MNCKKVAIAKFIGKMQKKSGIMKNGSDTMPLFLLDDLLTQSPVKKLNVSMKFKKS